MIIQPILTYLLNSENRHSQLTDNHINKIIFNTHENNSINTKYILNSVINNHKNTLKRNPDFVTKIISCRNPESNVLLLNSDIPITQTNLNSIFNNENRVEKCPQILALLTSGRLNNQTPIADNDLNENDIHRHYGGHIITDKSLKRYIIPMIRIEGRLAHPVSANNAVPTRCL